MHVVFVCASEKKAIARTAAVLDAYAIRIGERTWQTPVTTEGLTQIRASLRRSASKNTAVACWRNEGRTRLSLLWAVGSALRFTKHGAISIGTKSKTERADVPQFVRTCSVICRASGLGHDLGKNTKGFAAKLRSLTMQSDAIRHEWLSYKLLEQLSLDDPGQFNVVTLRSAWTNALAGVATDNATAVVLNQTPQSWLDVLKYVVLTHHVLPFNGSPENKHQAASIPNSNAYVRDGSRTDFTQQAGDFPQALLEKITVALKRCAAVQPPTTDHILYWRAVATYSRMAMIMADHSVSGIKYIKKEHVQEPFAYANTRREKGRRPLNQPLDVHLIDVGALAQDLAYRMWTYRPRALCPASRERLDKPSGAGRYEWQDKAANSLRALSLQSSQPTLVLNVAATGSGKTRANVRLLSALRANSDLRIATALSLRTLTLQTGDAYRDELQIEQDEIACIIGDKKTIDLHNAGSKVSNAQPPPPILVNEDENEVEDEFEASDTGDEPPLWLHPFLQQRPWLSTVVTAPVLVSTIDFLITAGEPNRQATHATAMLRLMHSDLILDEIDSYDPRALAAVARLVMYSAFWGRNVVASSATLSNSIAQHLHDMFDLGVRMRRAAIDQTVQGRIWMVSDTAAPVVYTLGGTQP